MSAPQDTPPEGYTMMVAAPSRAKVGLPPWRQRRLYYVRALAICILAVGLWEWSVALGLTSVDGKTFLDLRGPVRNALGAFLVIDLASAVGLWLGATWGPVLFLANVGASVLLHSVYKDTHGAAPIANVVWLVLAAGLIALSLMARRESAQLEVQRRRQRKERRLKPVTTA